MESNNTLNNTVNYESFEKCILRSDSNNIYELNKKPKKNKQKKNEFNCEIIESVTIEKSDNASSNTNHKKKKKHKVDNDEIVSDCRILKVEEIENNSRTEILNKVNQHKKKHKHKSFGEMENVSDNRMIASDEVENNRILVELYKRKRPHKHKQIKVDNLSVSLNTDINGLELSQNNLNSEISDGIPKQKKKKRHKLATAENLVGTVNMESNLISNNTVCNESIENSEDQNIKLNRKNNMHSETKAEKRYEKKHEDIDETQQFDGEVVESAMTEKSDNDKNSNKFHKKKRKQEMTDGENNVHSETKAEKHHKKKHRYINETQEFYGKVVELAISEKSGNNKNSNKFHRKKRKHEVADENIETDMPNVENETNVEFINSLRQQKKMKDKHKLLGERKNLFNYEESATGESGKNTILDILDVHKRKRKHKQIEVDNTFNCQTTDTNAVEINDNDLNSENYSKLWKKKRHKLVDEMENVSDCKTAYTNAVIINDNDLNCENYKKLWKKKKHKLLDENISDIKTVDSNTIEMNRNDLSSEAFNIFLKKKKKKHKHELRNEIKNLCDSNIKESAIDEQENNKILDVLGVQKGIDKCKQTVGDKIYDSNTIELKQNDLSSGTSNGLHKRKRKKQRHEASEVENIPHTSIASNNIIYLEHLKEKDKSAVQNSEVVRSSRMESTKKRKYMEHFESGVEIVLDDLQEKEKNASFKGPEKEKNYQAAEEVYTSFNSFTHDINEVLVPFIVPLLHEDETVGTITLQRRAFLEENGVTINTGKWTKTEDDILKRNFLQFGLEFGVNNPYQLLGINQSHKQNKLVSFLAAKHFWVRLGKDLNNRSLRSIYMRARKLLNPLNNKGKLSAGEAADLKYAHELLGNKWTRISDMLSRSDNNCYTAFRWHKSDINKGKWTLEEEKKLIEAIKSVAGTEDISANNLKNISWKEVARYVPTRNEFQCHKQWAEHLAWDPSVTEKKRWERIHYGKLIYLLKDKYCYNSEHEIDWRELHKHFNDVTPTHMFLRKKWLYMKGKLPKDFSFSYSQSLDALTSMYNDRYKIFAEGKT